MRLSRFAFLLAVSLLAVLPELAQAQAAALPPPPPPADTLRLTLPEAEQRFVANNLQVLAQTYNISTAQALARQARLVDNPTLVLEQNALNRTINREHFGPGSPGQVAVQATQLFSLAGRRRAAGRAQQQNAVVEQFNLEDLVRNLRFQLRATYYDLYFQQQTLRVYEAEVDSLGRNIAKYQRQYERGNIALKEVIRLKAFLFALQGERQTILATISQDQSDLHILLRDPAPTEYRPVVSLARARALSLNGFTESQLADTAAATRADVQARQAAVVQQSLNLKYQQKLSVPDLAVGYVYDKAGSYINDYHAFTIGMAVPVFNRNQGNIQAAKAQIAGATALAAQQQLTVRAEVFQAYELAQRSDALFQSTDRDTTPFARLMEGIEKSYAKRLISVVEYLDFYESYKNNLVQLNSLRAGRVRAFEQLNYTVGKPLFSAE